MIQTLAQFIQKPDVGRLKTAPGEYRFLQNIRGWAKKGSKRQGVRTIDTLTSGVMAIIDLKLDDSPDSLDKILVITNAGDALFYEPSEFFSFFNFEFQTGVGIVLQSPDLNWWRVEPGASNNWKVTGIAAPATTQSLDFNVSQSQLLGYQNGSFMERLYVETGFLKRQTYTFREADTVYSGDLGIVTGKGIVFQDATLQRWRLSVKNGGIFTITSL